MTKEDLIAHGKSKGMEYILDKFFETNVCIPKGKNRHPNADVIHSYAEGLNNIEVLRTEGWIDFKQQGMCLCIGDEYRIKPSEPIYEYLWLDLRTPDDFYCPTRKYMTEDEAVAYFSPSETYFKVLETKRIRQ